MYLLQILHYSHCFLVEASELQIQVNPPSQQLQANPPSQQFHANPPSQHLPFSPVPNFSFGSVSVTPTPIQNEENTVYCNIEEIIHIKAASNSWKNIVANLTRKFPQFNREQTATYEESKEKIVSLLRRLSI